MIKLEIHLDNRNSTTTKLTHTFAFAVWSKRVETQNEGMIINFNVYGPQTRNLRLCVAELNFGRVWLGAWVEHKKKGNECTTRFFWALNWNNDCYKDMGRESNV